MLARQLLNAPPRTAEYMNLTKISLTHKRIAGVPVIGAFLFTLGCGGEAWEDNLPVAKVGVDLMQPLLTFINDQQRTTLERLDLGCGLRKNAAKNIIDHRDGSDGVPGTSDDDLFDSSDDLDMVSKVGPATLSQLGSCARRYGYHIPRDVACKPKSHSATTPLTRRFVQRVSDLSPILAAMVLHLEAEAPSYGDPDSDHPMKFGSVMIGSASDDLAVRYEVMFFQPLDPVAGTAAQIVFALDSCFFIEGVDVTFAPLPKEID